MTRAILLLGCLLLASCQTPRTDAGISPDAVGMVFPRMKEGAAIALTTRLGGTLVREGSSLRVRDGGGTVVVVWPFTAALDREGGRLAVRNRITGDIVRVGRRIVVTGSPVADCAALALDPPGAPACAGPAFVAGDFRHD